LDFDRVILLAVNSQFRGGFELLGDLSGHVFALFVLRAVAARDRHRALPSWWSISGNRRSSRGRR